jgi:hypothetical protein
MIGVPHISYSAVTKPVPVRIEVTLKSEYLIASKDTKSLNIIRYEITAIEAINSVLKNPLTC